jgi:hypothetical protein
MLSFPKISPTTLLHHKDAMVRYVVTLAANLAPLWLGMAYVIWHSSWIGLSQFYESGEFYIYSAALLGPAFLVFFDYKKKIYDRFSLLSLVCMGVAGLSAVFYTFLLADKANPGAPPSFSSYAILVITLLIYYYASYTDIAKRAPDVVGEERAAVEKIMDQLGGQ